MSSFGESISRRDYLKALGGLGALGLLLPGEIGKFSEELDEIRNEFSEARDALEDQEDYPESARIPLQSVNEIPLPEIEREIPLMPLVNETGLEREDPSENTNPSELYERAKERGLVPNLESQFESLAFENTYSVRVHPIYDPSAEPIDRSSRQMFKERVERANAGLNDLRWELVPGNYDIEAEVTEGETVEPGTEVEKALQVFDRSSIDIEDVFTFGFQEIDAIETLREYFHDQPGAVPIFITNQDYGSLYGKGGEMGAVVSEGSRDSFEKFQATFIHEEGHGFGGLHAAHRDSVMAQPYNPEASGLEVGERLVSYFERMVSGEEDLHLEWDVAQEPATPVLKQRWLTESLDESENLKEQRNNLESYARDVLGFERIDEMTFAGRSVNGNNTVLKYRGSVEGNSYNVEFHLDAEGFMEDMKMSVHF